MGVCGQYVDKFSDASHVLFEGHLDDPFFRKIAIQKVVEAKKAVVDCEISGSLEIKKRGKKEFVSLRYAGFFGMETTKGFPFRERK